MTQPACPQKHLHTKSPSGYMQWHSWAHDKAKTHRQAQCPGCGLWEIWRRFKPGRDRTGGWP